MTNPSRLAERHYAANLASIYASHPPLASLLRDQDVQAVEWLFARDRSLTALNSDGQWFSGCSLPLRSARAMLPKLSITGTTGCLIAPPHAAPIHIALELLQPNQAVVALLDDTAALQTILHLHDFSQDISGHRLFFAAGGEWAAPLEDLFLQNPGLPVPMSFI